MKMPWKKEEEKEPTSEHVEEETTEGEGESKKTPESPTDTPPTDTGAEGPFESPELAGYGSEKELIDALAVRDVTISEQRNAVAAAGNQPEPTPEPEPEPVKVTSEEFFADPGKAMNDAISAGIQSQMKEIVSELRQDMAVTRAKTAWDEAGEQISNLAEMRPMIEAVLSRNKITSPTVLQIVGACDMAVGQAQRQGVDIPGAEVRTPAEANKREIRDIPQHSPSTHPIATTEKKETFEPLNENEIRLARENNMTHEQFRAWSAVHEDEVLLVEEKS